MDIAASFETIRPRYPELKDRVALVTGSSMGIGQGIALRLAAEGMQVVVHGIEDDEIRKTVETFTELGLKATGINANFAQRDGVDVLFEQLREQHTRLDVLVNNAADLRRTGLHDATVEMLDHQLAVNTRAPYLCVMQAAPMMERGASIINISSVGGQQAHWRGLPYDVTKGAIEIMTRAMSLELSVRGIRMNGVAPGAIRVSRSLHKEHEFIRAQEARIPLQRMGTPLEIAAAVAFLASDEASYITGHMLNVDGGITAQLSPPGQQI